MIAALKGKLLSQSGETIVVDVGGVGYELIVCDSARRNLKGIGSEAALLVYTDVRENAITLFGFSEQSEREIFLLLKKVKGVGSKLAITVLSHLPPEDLLVSIGHGDVSLLTKVPGIGKKTAERMVMELREHVGEMAIDLVRPLGDGIEMVRASRRSETSGTPMIDDAVLALEKLGFSNDKARLAVQHTVSGQKGIENFKDAGELLKAALGNLS